MVETKDFRWPGSRPEDVTQAGVHPESPYTYAAMEKLRRELAAKDGALFDAEVAKCIRDRDELVAALEKAVAFHWEDPDFDGEAENDRCRTLLARIKAGG